MPSKKRKYNARFPPGRIKKIMQTDEEVGKVAQAVPIIISRTLELFAHSLLTKTVHITNTRQAKTLSPAHMKQCILSESRFDFLRDLVKNIPDATGLCENNAYALGGHALALPPPPMFPSNTIIAPAILPRSSTAAASNIVPKEESSCAQAPPKRRSIDKGDKAESIKVESIKAEPAEAAVEDNETVFSCDVPKSKTPVPITFNASQPNFYTELNSSNSSDNVSISNSYIKPVSNFSHTANIDEDYDT